MKVTDRRRRHLPRDEIGRGVDDGAVERRQLDGRHGGRRGRLRRVRSVGIIRFECGRPLLGEAGGRLTAGAGFVDRGPRPVLDGCQIVGAEATTHRTKSAQQVTKSGGPITRFHSWIPSAEMTNVSVIGTGSRPAACVVAWASPNSHTTVTSSPAEPGRLAAGTVGRGSVRGWPSEQTGSISWLPWAAFHSSSISKNSSVYSSSPSIHRSENVASGANRASTPATSPALYRPKYCR